MTKTRFLLRLVLTLFLLLPGLCLASSKQDPVGQAPKVQPAPEEASEQQDLQKAINDAANDRAALAKNLEAFLEKYPQAAQRPQIYRALVEANLQLRDFPRATAYAERLAALHPDDLSNLLLTIQLLERYGDPAGYRRAVSYCTRVIEQVERSSSAAKSPRMSQEGWEQGKKQDQSSLLQARGRLYEKLNDPSNAERDFAASYALVPSAAAALHLGEIAESNRDSDKALQQYARAFALASAGGGTPSPAEIRKKIGNVWRLAHGSEQGLGDYLLQAFDAANTTGAAAKPARNSGAKDPFEFVLRDVKGGPPVDLAQNKGKVLVLNFWATWCGPCREMEPHFERIAARYGGRKNIVFYALNCDDDESLVLPYLQGEKSKTTVLFADGLNQLLGVSAYPTTLILDPEGKIAFRLDGFDPDTVDDLLPRAIERIAPRSGVEKQQNF